MRQMLLLFIFFSSIAFSTINECKTDVYFGNGILTKENDAKFNAEVILKPAIIEKLGGLKNFKKHIGKVDYIYRAPRKTLCAHNITSLSQDKALI